MLEATSIDFIKKTSACLTNTRTIINRKYLNKNILLCLQHDFDKKYWRRKESRRSEGQCFSDKWIGFIEKSS